MKTFTVAIIIPVKHFNAHLKKCLDHCFGLDFPNFEILVFPDEPFPVLDERIRVIPTGAVGPAAKRDLALRYSQAEIYAFLDDDAYPESDWLKNALSDFQDEQVAAVGGPAVTPKDSALREIASGLIFSSILASGNYVYRYIPKKKQEVDDYPSCNFLIRRSIFEQLGGFNNKFWPGEDTKLCLDITKKLGKKIIYDPKVLVQHHRRRLGLPHLRQVANYGLHRGYFSKRFHETSRRISYFIPSFFLLYLIFGMLFSVFNKTISFLYISSLILYGLIIFSATLFNLTYNRNLNLISKIKLILPVTIGIILTHLTYGLFFIKGLLSLKLKEE